MEPQPEALLENYHAVVYGVPDGGTQVSVAQYSLDFSTNPPTFALNVVTNGNGNHALLTYASQFQCGGGCRWKSDLG